MNGGGNEFFEEVFRTRCYTIPRTYRSRGQRTYRSRGHMMQLCHHIWSDQEGQDIAEYAVMLAVILVLVIGTIRLIGGNANNAFSTVASSLSQ
jgi:Flp pilus assembly pilin Flp